MKHTIITSGETAGEDLRQQLNDLDADLEDVVRAEVSLTVEVSEETEDYDIPCLIRDSKEFELLELTDENPGITAQEAKDTGNFNSATGTYAALTKKGVVDREKVGLRYQYRVSEKGQQELSYHR